MPVHPLWLFSEVLEHYPASMNLLPISGLVLRSRVIRDRIGDEHGRLLLDVPVALARAMKRTEDSRDFAMLVHIERGVVDDVVRRRASGLVLPPSNGGLVRG